MRSATAGGNRSPLVVTGHLTCGSRATRRIVALGCLAMVTLGGARRAPACSCSGGVAHVLPVAGSVNVSPESRLFLYRPRSVIRSWWPLRAGRSPHPIQDWPGSYELNCDGEPHGFDISMHFALGGTDPPRERPHWIWITPTPELPVGASCHLMQHDDEGRQTLLTSFGVAADESAVSAALDGCVEAFALEFRFRDGTRPRGGSCGGTNALEATLMVSPRGCRPDCDNIVIDLEAEQVDSDGRRVRLQYPLAAYRWRHPRLSAFPFGYTPTCSDGLRVEADECSRWCATATPMNLHGVTGSALGPQCNRIASLEPGPSNPALPPPRRVACPPADLGEENGGEWPDLGSRDRDGGCPAERDRGEKPGGGCSAHEPGGNWMAQGLRKAAVGVAWGIRR